jgi:hypothetical protein
VSEASADYDALVETLTHALHSTETAQGWYGEPECAEVGRALAPHVQALMAQAWDAGYLRAVEPESDVRDNPYQPRATPPGGQHG